MNNYQQFIKRGYNLSNNGKFPDFLGLGVRRAASTYMFNILSQHPEISFPEMSIDKPFCCDKGIFKRLQKERKFTVKETQFWTPFYIKPFAEKKKFLNAYTQLFNPEKLCGENGATYLLFLTFVPEILQFLHECKPDIKLFFTIRNPIDRFISDYHYRPMGGTFEKVLRIVKNRVKNNKINKLDYYNRLYLSGLYDISIKKLLEYFKPDQIFVINFEALTDSPEEIFKRLCRFLEIDETFKFKNLNKKVTQYHDKKVYQSRNNVTQQQRNDLKDIYRHSIVETSMLLKYNLGYWLE